ncbi:Rho guanine nucleotide exchange factor 4, partial [Cladochytrium tenue]
MAAADKMTAASEASVATTAPASPPALHDVVSILQAASEALAHHNIANASVAEARNLDPVQAAEILRHTSRVRSYCDAVQLLLVGPAAVRSDAEGRITDANSGTVDEASSSVGSSSSNSRDAGFSLADLGGLGDRVFRAGASHAAAGEMDINVRAGDRVKFITAMDDGGASVLGSNLETGATGTFAAACVLRGRLLAVDEESRREAAAASMAAVVEVVEAAAAADVAMVLPDGSVLVDADGWPTDPRAVRAATTGSIAARRGPTATPTAQVSADSVDEPLYPEEEVDGSAPTSRESTVRRPDPDGEAWAVEARSSRPVGVHVAMQSYDSKSVLETSLEAGDVVYVLYWQDDDVAVGIHIRSQTESLFMGSLLRYDGVDPKDARPAVATADAAIGVKAADGQLQDEPRNSIVFGVSTAGDSAAAAAGKRPALFGPRVRARVPVHSVVITPSATLASARPRPAADATAALAARGHTVGGYGGGEVEGETRAKNAAAVPFVINEMHTTEVAYVETLRLFRDHVIEPIRERRLLSDVDFDIAFKRFGPILALAEKVEAHLREARRDDPASMVNVFLRNIEREEWSVYESYIRHYLPGRQVIATMEARVGPDGDAFREFVRQLERVEPLRRRTIQDLLMTPIQRITRYWLLLGRLRGFVQPGSQLSENIQIAEDYMREIGNTLQKIQAREDAIRQMFQIFYTVENLPIGLLSYTKRRFLGDYAAHDTAGRRAGFGFSAADGFAPLSPRVDAGPGPRRLLLFSDCLLVAAPCVAGGTPILAAAGMLTGRSATMSLSGSAGQ